jgi:hypothetical protein
MPTERIAPPDSHALTYVRDAARERGRTLMLAAAKLLNLNIDEHESEKATPAARTPGRRTPRRERLGPLEAWLGAGCIVVVLWAVGWL